MASIVVTICFRELLRDVCHRFSLPMPKYGVPVENEEGIISVYVEIELARGDTVTESVRCWSMPCSNIDQTEEDAACRSVGKLRDEFSFEVRDFNFKDTKFFENLYERLFTDRNTLSKKYKRLKDDYNLLREYYNNLFAEKDRYVAERGKLKKLIDKGAKLLDRPNAIAADQNSDGDNSNEDTVRHLATKTRVV